MYNIEILAKLAGITKRTVRYYIEKGLLEPPAGNCRGSYYTTSHLEQLENIKKWAQQGIPLSQVKSLLEGECTTECINAISVICTTKWEKLKINDGFEVHFWENSVHPDDLKAINDFIISVIGKR